MTDMRRGESIYDLDPSSHEKVERGIEEDGSNLSGVTSRCWWEEWHVVAGGGGGDADDDQFMNERHEISQTGQCDEFIILSLISKHPLLSLTVRCIKSIIFWFCFQTKKKFDAFTAKV